MRLSLSTPAVCQTPRNGGVPASPSSASFRAEVGSALSLLRINTLYAPQLRSRSAASAETFALRDTSTMCTNGSAWPSQPATNNPMPPVPPVTSSVDGAGGAEDLAVDCTFAIVTKRDTKIMPSRSATSGSLCALASILTSMHEASGFRATSAQRTATISDRAARLSPQDPA